MDHVEQPLRRARPRRLAALAVAGALVLLPSAALAAPTGTLVVAAEEAEEGSEEAPGRRPIAETPRDVLALAVLGAFLAAAALGTANARRQLRGERPRADGRFRWR